MSNTGANVCVPTPILAVHPPSTHNGAHNGLSGSPDGPVHPLMYLLLLPMRPLRIPEKFRQELESNGRENFLTGRRENVVQITTVQGLVLLTSAAFLTTTPPVQSLNYGSASCYGLFSVAFLTSISGLILQSMFFSLNLSLTMVESEEPLPYLVVAMYLRVYNFALATFILSLWWLASAFWLTFLGWSKWYFLFAAGAFLIQIISNTLQIPEIYGRYGEDQIIMGVLAFAVWIFVLVVSVLILVKAAPYHVHLR